MSTREAERSPFLVEAERHLAARRFDEAEVELSRFSPDDDAYRDACLLVIEVARARGEVTFRADHLLQRFLEEPPRDDASRVAMETVAALYDAQGLDDLAADVRALLVEKPVSAAHALPDLPPLPPPKSALPTLPTAPPAPREPARTDVAPLPGAPSVSAERTLPMAAQRGSVADASTTGVWASISDGIGVAAAEEAPPTPPPKTPGAPRTPRSSPTASDATRDTARSAFQVGAVVNDRYEILDQLGKGGMATVYRVYDRELDEAVALKLFQQDLTDDESPEVMRFKRELKLARRLRHPNIVQLFDLGVFAGRYYITMELLDGDDLHRVLRTKRAPWALKDVVALALQICAGLEAAHAAGVVHRDVKPANIFIPSRGPLKIMDFGIAKAGEDAGDLATKTGMMMGTPQYMAPEQAQDAARVGPESDLYAVGVILFELLSGRRPFDGTNLMAVLVDVVTKPAPSLLEARPDLPVAVHQLVARLLAKNPEARPRSAAEVARLLASAIA